MSTTHDLRGYLGAEVIPEGDGIHCRLRLPIAHGRPGDYVLVPGTREGIRYRIVSLYGPPHEPSAVVTFAPRTMREVQDTPSMRIVSAGVEPC